MINSTTKNMIRDIQSKLKTPVTGQKEFATEDAVIEYAIRNFHTELKKQRLI